MIDYYATKSQPITKLMVWQAYKRVRANKGSGGIDGMSWTYLDLNAGKELYKLWNRMSSGSYYPKAVRQVGIPKKDGGTRYLGVPTLLDRIAQEVVRLHLERILDPLFHKSSFGYRRGKNAHQAVAASMNNCINHDFVIDLDIKGYFDNIDHELLLKGLTHYCKDKWVVMYVERWIKAGVITTEGMYQDRLTGTPQGGVISPLLSNLFLHIVFDKWMEKHHPEKPFERYADDIVVHCKTERQANYMKRMIRNRMLSCKLTLHPEKTKVVNLRGSAEKKYPKRYDFLGFTIKPHVIQCRDKARVMPGIFVSQKSKQSAFRKFRELELHKWRKPFTELAKVVNPIVRGLSNYYQKF
jgi:group II intron reverse transcriptase/maturase